MNLLPKIIMPFLCTSFFLQGCSFIKETIGLGPRRPKVQIYAIEVKKATVLAIDLQITVQIENPNDFALKLSRLRYNMNADALAVAAGQYDPEITIPPSVKTLVKLPLKVNAESVIKLMQMLLDGNADPVALITATADFQTPFGPIEVDFDDRRPLRKMAGLKH
jgi:LEA14-like dessication related protein